MSTVNDGLGIGSLLTVCITTKHLCTAGLYAAHDLYHVRTFTVCEAVPYLSRYAGKV